MTNNFFLTANRLIKTNPEVNIKKDYKLRREEDGYAAANAEQKIQKKFDKNNDGILKGEELLLYETYKKSHCICFVSLRSCWRLRENNTL